MSSPSSGLTLNPAEYFRELVAKAIFKQNLKVGEEIEYYLVTLLCDFISPTKLLSEGKEIDILEMPLALVLKSAIEAKPIEKLRIYKLLGDTSLYMSGYFQDFFNRKTFDIDYYIALGSSAYYSLAELSRTQKSDTFTAKTYSNLANNFNKLVEVVAEVSDFQTIKKDLNLLSTYERWANSKSERLRKKLEDSGITPIPLSKSKN